jgi:hypothetical protein
MVQPENKFSNFVSWWMQGLASVFPAPKPQVVILYVEGDSVHSVNEGRLSDNAIDKLKHSSNIYLLAPPESVMSKPLSDRQKGLFLNSIVEDLLPFEANELVVARDNLEEVIYAVVKSEVSRQRKIVAEHGLIITGIAFAHGDEYVYAEESDQSQTKFSKMFRASLAALIVIVISFYSTYGALSHFQRQRQTALIDQLSQLKKRLDVQPLISPEIFSTQFKIRTAADVLSLLSPLAGSLSEKVVIDQLILSDRELLIDAKAPNASQVLAGVEGLDIYGSSEFVTSISKGVNDQLERFRLKIDLRAEQ